MRKLRVFLCIIFILGCTALFMGCGAYDLSTPRGMRIDGDTLTLSWYAVPDARYYSVSINGDERDTRKNSYALSGLAEGRYTIKVKAYGGGGETESDWSSPVNFVREREPGMGFTLINNKKEYEVTSMGSVEGNVIIPDTYRGKPVTSIGRRAFAARVKLTGITLGKNITNIGEQAFYNCSYLKTANIPENVTTIGEQAFQGCRELQGEIIIPNSVTEIGDGAFSSCHSVTGLKIGNSVVTIGNSAFSDCRNVPQIIIPDSVTQIGEYAFSRCTSATELKMGKGLKSVGARAFYDCTGLTSVVLGDSVEDVGIYAFADCTSVTSAVIPDSVITIGGGAFNGCTSLTTVSLGRNVKSIGRNAFYDTAFWKPAPPEGEDGGEQTYAEGEDALVYVGSGDRIWLVGVRDTSKTEYDADIADDVYAIGGGAFYKHAKLSSVMLPNSVKIIDNYAFYGCGELLSVTIGSGATQIGEYAFSDCVKLNLLYLGAFDDGSLGESSLEYIGNYAFKGCTVLANTFSTPASLRKIGTQAFNNTAMWSVVTPENAVVYAGDWVVGYAGQNGSQLYPAVKLGTVGIADYAFFNSPVMIAALPESVEYIGRGAFSGCRLLQAVSLPDNLKRIEAYTFYNCGMLVLNKLPETLEYIGQSAFYGCKALGMTGQNTSDITFIIPDSVTEIADYAFYGCGITNAPPEGSEESPAYEGVDKVIIGSGVKSIGNYAFANFVSLKHVVIGDSVTLMGQRAFYRCVSLETVKFGTSLTEIGERTFYGCQNLGKKQKDESGKDKKNVIEIPDNITEIGKYAFYRCESLENISFGDGLKTIGDYAFTGCSSLRGLSFNNVTEIGKQAFRNCTKIADLIISDSVKSIGAHAFYGCVNLTVYTEYREPAEGFDSWWNSSYRTVVWGVNLDETKSYVVSVTKNADTVSNFNPKTPFFDPSREGYLFDGWSTSADSVVPDYNIIDISGVPNGTTVYAVWTSLV